MPTQTLSHSLAEPQPREAFPRKHHTEYAARPVAWIEFPKSLKFVCFGNEELIS
jgi:hypothetical protein